MSLWARASRAVRIPQASLRRRLLSTASIPVVYEDDHVKLLSMPATPLAMNQYLLGCKKTGSACIIDSGDSDGQRWIDAASAHELTITKLLQTHGHVDHVSGLANMKDLLAPIDVYACPDDWIIFKSAPAQGLMFGLTCPSPPSIDVDVHDGDEIEVGDLKLEAMFTPGHSPGHLSFYMPEHSLLLVGDLLFKGSVGRTDFPGCSVEAMKSSLNRVSSLPPDTLVWPGHMGPTTIGDELLSNPFLQKH